MLNMNAAGPPCRCPVQQAYYNALDGELPHKLPPGLIQLALTGNSFTGSLPALPRGMKYLSLAENGLSGPLPNGPGAAQLWFVSVPAASGSEPLSAVDAMYTGALASMGIGQDRCWRCLQGVDGTAPAWLRWLPLSAWPTHPNVLRSHPAAVPAVAQADLSSNAFSGAIPAVLSQSAQLVYLNVSNNQLTGIESAEQWSTPALMTLDASYNQIEGEQQEAHPLLPGCAL